MEAQCRPYTNPEKIQYDIPKYDSTWDPHDHIMAYTTEIKGNDLIKEENRSVLIKKFGETLTERALTWYSHMPEHSISFFVELADASIKAHSKAQKVKKQVYDYTKKDKVTTRLYWPILEGKDAAPGS